MPSIVSRSIGLAVAAFALAVPTAASALEVEVFAPGPYSFDQSSSIFIFGDPGESSNITIAASGTSVTVQDTGATTVTSSSCVVVGNTATCAPPNGKAIRNIYGFLGDGNDTLACNLTAPPEGGDLSSGFNGHSGNDTLDGCNAIQGHESLHGGSGNDTLRGRAGDDYLDDLDYTEDDPLLGATESGDDNLAGGDGDDYLQARRGNNVMDGGNHLDVVAYNIPPVFDANDNFVPPTAETAGANVTLNSSPGARVATTGNGLPGQNDTINNVEDIDGSEGADKLTGSAVGNVIRGFGGNDVIVGGAGPDNLQGNGDKDAINSQDGEVDRVNCGNQTDDSAAVDNIDQVSGCPVAGTTTVTVQPTPPVVIREPTDKTPATVTVSASKRVRAATLRRRGKYSFRLTPSEAVVGEFSLAAKVGRLVSISTAGYVTLAETRRTLAAKTSRKITLTVQKSLRRALRKGRTIRLLISLRDGGGNITARRITIKLR